MPINQAAIMWALYATLFEITFIVNLLGYNIVLNNIYI